MKVKRLIAFLFVSLLFCSCKYGENAKYRNDTSTSGAIDISVDESFKPIMDSQIQVFESQYPNAKINVHYKPEADCFRDLKYDSVRMVIVTRGLTDDETKILADTLKFSPSFGILAYGAIAVIVNSQVKDSLFALEDIRSMLNGTSGYKYKVVLDGNNSTSTVRFVMDSILKGAPLSKNVTGAKGSEAVLNYIGENTDAIGLIGVSWIGNKDDPQQGSFLKKVNIASIECQGCSNGPFIKPYQYNIYTGRYPLIRPLYYILKENYEGLGSGFKNFLIYEKGQRIFKRAYLLPARMKFEVQNMKISK